MSGNPPGPPAGTETFLTLRGPHETNETDDPAAYGLGAHADLLRGAYLRDAEPLVARARGGGGVHGDAGVPLCHHGGSENALGLLPRLQPSVQRDAAHARGAAVAARRNRERRPREDAAAHRHAVPGLHLTHAPVR